MAELPPVLIRILSDASALLAAAEQSISALQEVANAASSLDDTPATAGLQAELQQLTEAAQDVAADFVDVGKTLTAAITAPLAGVAGVGVKAWTQQEDASARLRHILDRTGASAWTTQEALEALASEIQRTTRFSDEAAIAAEAILLRFDQIKASQFERVLRLAADAAAASGRDIETAALMLGRALQNPATGMRSLRSLGIQLDAATQELVKSMMEAGNVAGAQEVIMQKLEQRYGGLAQTMRQTTAGSLAALRNRIGDFFEMLGQVVAPLVSSIANALERLVHRLQQIPLSTLRTAFAFAAVAAAVGPAIYLTGKLMSGITWLGTTGAALLRGLALRLALLTPAGQQAADAINAISTALFGASAKTIPLTSQMRMAWAGVIASIQSAALAVQSFVVQLWRAAAAHPVLAAITVALAAITAAVFAAVAVFNWARENVESFGRAWDQVKAAVGAAMSAVGKVVAVVMSGIVAPIFSHVASVIRSFAERVAAWLERNKDTIKRWVSVAGAAAVMFVRFFTDVVWPGVSKVIGGLAQLFMGLLGVIADVIKVLTHAQTAWWKLMKGDVVGAIREGKKTLDAFDSAMRNVGKAAAGIFKIVQAPFESAGAASVFFENFREEGRRTAEKIAAEFDKAWASAGERAEEAKEEMAEEPPPPQVPDVEEALKKEVPELETKFEPIRPVSESLKRELVAPLKEVARDQQLAAEKQVEAADQQAQAAEELRRVLVSREGVVQIIGGLVQRESEESVLAALHTIEGAIRR